ncbi:hypothetical protein V5O48_003632 [Marasmius crinis-equi]|uniref:Uncharacterized protein n=1 Tax=Marasmius crinis-equi TaxID=585013 RepID=A0ABR3FT48_9AGAR
MAPEAYEATKCPEVPSHRHLVTITDVGNSIVLRRVHQSVFELPEEFSTCVRVALHVWLDRSGNDPKAKRWRSKHALSSYKRSRIARGTKTARMYGAPPKLPERWRIGLRD